MSEDHKEEKKEKEEKYFNLDKFFDDLSTKVTETLKSFIAFLFLLLAVGAAYGFFVTLKHTEIAPLLVILPAVLGLIAYYNKTFAIAIFVLLIIGLILV